MGIDSESSTPGYSVDETWYAVGGQTIVVATPFAQPSRAIWVGGNGNITLTMRDGSSLQLIGIVAGTLLPISATNVSAATASNMVALW